MKRLILVSIVLAVGLVLRTMAVAEEDHLLVYKIKSLEKLKPNTTHVVTNQFGTNDCEIKGTAKFFLVQSEKDGGDDPRGGRAGDFACYKAKCTGDLPPDTEVDHQLGVETFESKKLKLLCLPVGVCGDGNLDPGEECDGTADAACPGLCQPDCTCTPQTCGNNIVEGSEECDPPGPDNAECPYYFCGADCTCLLLGVCAGGPIACEAYRDEVYVTGTGGPCSACCMGDAGCFGICDTAALQSCTDLGSNDACATAADAAGCGVACCGN